MEPKRIRSVPGIFGGTDHYDEDGNYLSYSMSPTNITGGKRSNSALKPSAMGQRTAASIPWASRELCRISRLERVAIVTGWTES